MQGRRVALPLLAARRSYEIIFRMHANRRDESLLSFGEPTDRSVLFRIPCCRGSRATQRMRRNAQRERARASGWLMQSALPSQVLTSRLSCCLHCPSASGGTQYEYTPTSRFALPPERILRRRAWRTYMSDVRRKEP